MNKVIGNKKYLLILTVLFLIGCEQNQQTTSQEQAVEVQVLKVHSAPLQITAEWPGRIEALRSAEVKAQVSGIILKRYFEEGREVHAGEVLFQIDPAPYEALLLKAKGEQAKAEAELFEAKAKIDRYTPLMKKEAISKYEYDTALAAFKVAQANKDSAIANVKTAQLNLDYTTVKAPISGRIGRALVTEGALVGKDEATSLAKIQQVDPIYADFSIPVKSLTQLQQLAINMKQKNNTSTIPLSIQLEASNTPIVGHLLFADISVDKSTGQVLLRGEFNNQDGLLLPGMYVRVQTTQELYQNAILLPQRAVHYDKEGIPQVFVVTKEQIVSVKTVQVGKMMENQWQIVSGLSEDELVVIGGQVNEGRQVVIENSAHTVANTH